MNTTTIIGNLTADPTQYAVAEGRNVTNFTVAVHDRTPKGEKTTFFRVSAWGKRGDACKDYLQKNSRVRITGKVSARPYTSKNGINRASLELSADEVEFLSPIARQTDEPNPNAE